MIVKYCQPQHLIILQYINLDLKLLFFAETNLGDGSYAPIEDIEGWIGWL